MAIPAVMSGFTAQSNNIEKGRKAYEQNEKVHPKIDSICQVVKESDEGLKQFLNVQRVRDSFLIRTVDRIDRRLESIDNNK